MLNVKIYKADGESRTFIPTKEGTTINKLQVQELTATNSDLTRVLTIEDDDVCIVLILLNVIGS